MVTWALVSLTKCCSVCSAPITYSLYVHSTIHVHTNDTVWQRVLCESVYRFSCGRKIYNKYGSENIQ